MTYSQRRVISLRRANPDDDGIDMGAQSMEMIKRRAAVNPSALTSHSRDPAVQGLAKLRDDERTIRRCIKQGNENVIVAGPAQRLDCRARLRQDFSC